jgi:hypothetical protein
MGLRDQNNASMQKTSRGTIYEIQRLHRPGTDLFLYQGMTFSRAEKRPNETGL